MSTKRRRPLPSAAWAAGFVDGEGCIHLAKQRFKRRRCPRTRKWLRRRPTFRLRLSCTQNDYQVLAHLQSVLGPRGRIYACKRQNTSNRRTYTLNYDGDHALAAIKKVRPYLLRKDAEADVAIQYESSGWMGVHPGPKGYPEHVWAAREWAYRKLQKLK